MQAKKLIQALVLSTAMLSVGACSAIDGKESAGQYADDTGITTKVKAKIANDTTLNPLEINVETLRDQVQLSGFVTSQADKMRAESLARSVDGVRGVKNSIVVR